MAIEALGRWQMIRSVITEKKSGTLIVQLGRNSLYWIIKEGRLICVSSTLPEYSFTQFLLKKDLKKEEVLRGQAQIDERKSLGSVLTLLNVCTEQDLIALLREHWASLTFHLLQSTTHVFWSSRETEVKQQFVPAEIPLDQLILTVDRSAVEVRTAIRFSQSMPAPYRIANWRLVETALPPKEQRLMHYLRSGAPLALMLKDPDLDHVTCHRVCFLLWLSGSLIEQRPFRKQIALPMRKRAIWTHLSAIPPEWIFPLFIGVMIGVVLSPSAPPNLHDHQTTPRMEKLKDSLQKPAWQPKALQEETGD